MKRITQCVCLLLICSMILIIPVSANSRSMDASDYFMSSSAYLNELSGSNFQVCFDVTAVDYMDELGASVIKVQRSSNGSDWKTVLTRTKEDYSAMIVEDDFDHNYHFTYYGTSGYYYRAYVEFYAKKGNGTAYYSCYTPVIP